jgi:hypothetical protein
MLRVFQYCQVLLSPPKEGNSLRPQRQDLLQLYNHAVYLFFIACLHTNWYVGFKNECLLVIKHINYCRHFFYDLIMVMIVDIFILNKISKSTLIALSRGSFVNPSFKRRKNNLGSSLVL